MRRAANGADRHDDGDVAATMRRRAVGRAADASRHRGGARAGTEVEGGPAARAAPAKRVAPEGNGARRATPAAVPARIREAAARTEASGATPSSRCTVASCSAATTSAPVASPRDGECLHESDDAGRGEGLELTRRRQSSSARAESPRRARRGRRARRACRWRDEPRCDRTRPTRRVRDAAQCHAVEEGRGCSASAASTWSVATAARNCSRSEVRTVLSGRSVRVPTSGSASSSRRRV